MTWQDISSARPVFEVIDCDTGHTYRIWANGRIEGFGDRAVVFNRIPQLVAKAEATTEAERIEAMEGK